MSGFFLDDIEIGDKSQRAVNAINDIIGCLRPAENYINQICEKINQLGLSNIRFVSQKRFYDDMEEAASKISAYNRITEEYDNDVDRKFSDKYSDVVSELSRIKVKDITIKNNLGITEIRNTNGYRYPVEKAEITLEDLLSYGEFGDIIKESYEGYCERVELSDEEDIYTFDKYVEAISEIGEFEDPKILERKRKISTLLDCVPFVGFGKTLIEVISGENLITHEKLSFLERVIAGVSLIPIGAIAKWLKGVFKGGINSLLRRVGKSAITDIGEEVTEAVIKDEVRGLEKNIASEVTEDVVREIVEEIGEVEGREVVESRIKTNFANEIPRSSEEWNEYFVGKYGADNVERVIKEGVSNHNKYSLSGEEHYESLKDLFGADNVKWETKGKKYDNAIFANDEKLVSHYWKHGKEFGAYSLDDYLNQAREVMNNGYEVNYLYKGEIRTGFLEYYGNSKKNGAKFAFVGTNNEGFITTFHTESGKTFWKMLNGENIKVINPK